MSFFMKRNKKNEMDLKIQLIYEKLQSLEKSQEEQQSLQADYSQKMLSRQRKSESVIESIFEAIEEYKAVFQQQNMIKSNEKALAAFIRGYDESLQHMERMLINSEGEDSEWVKQLHMMREQLCEGMAELELLIIKDCDIPVDFALHEVIGISYTDQAERNSRVCEIIAPGLYFQNEVQKKAKVIVYKYKEDTKE
jgi:molecular chaperone GrpE (heat shock protein)